MGKWFPTFRRWMNIGIPLPTLWWGRASWAQRQSLMRLLDFAIEENLPPGPLVESWAADETGRQRRRLLQLSELLAGGTALPDAVEEVPGVLGDEDVLAIRFGAQSGTLAASLRDRLDEPVPVWSSVTPRTRKLLIYMCVLLFFGFPVVTFLQIKILPEFEKILVEFSVTAPAALRLSVALSHLVVDYWYLFALALMAAIWLVFLPWPGRRLRRVFLGRFFRPLRELHTADMLEKLSVAVQAGRPLAGALSTLARYHFNPTLRRQLLFVRNEIEQGADVWQSMAAIGLLAPAEARVMETANRVGNRPWALKQIALVKRRRVNRRVSRWSELLLPIVILSLGAFVLLQALSVFGPLVMLVTNLT